MWTHVDGVVRFPCLQAGCAQEIPQSRSPSDLLNCVYYKIKADQLFLIPTLAHGEVIMH